MRISSSIQGRSVLAGGYFLALAIGWVGGTGARAAAATDRATAAFSAAAVDPSFVRALPAVKQAAGLRETNSALVLPAWMPGQCMLIGFRTDIDAKRFIHLVEVTTLEPAGEGLDAGHGRGMPVSRRSFSFSSGQTNRLEVKPRVHTFVSTRYPVRVRLFDGEGALMREGRELLPWSFLTNGLVDVCDALRAQQFDVNPAAVALTSGARSSGGSSSVGALSPELESRIARGRLALGGLFSIIGRSRALEPVREHAIAVVRMPSLWRTVLDMKLDLRLDPRFAHAIELPRTEGWLAERRLGFPLLLLQGERTLTTVDFVAGSTEGAYFLTSGVRAFRATHPTKPGRRLLAQVLAVGMAELHTSIAE